MSETWLAKQPLLIGGILTLIAAFIIASFALSRSRNMATPDSFELSFSGTGLVESISSEKDGYCGVQIALYDWINISQGFSLGEIPKRSDRYLLQGEADVCNAVTMAMSSTSNHIAFRAGYADDKWYFAERPAPALGCGGLVIDWRPAPL